MNSNLSDLNQRIGEIEQYFLERHSVFFIAMSESDRKDFIEKKNEYQDEYLKILREIGDIIQSLESDELLVAFHTMCESIQAQMIQYMIKNYKEDFHKLMINELHIGKSYSYQLLSFFVREMSDDAQSLVVQSFANPNRRVRLDAYEFAKMLNLPCMALSLQVMQDQLADELSMIESLLVSLDVD